MKRGLVAAASALCASAMGWLLLEILYRSAHGIPLSGGTLYQEELRMPEGLLAERPWYRDFLERFRLSDDPILFYEPRPGYQGSFLGEPGAGPGALIEINSQGFRDREFPLAKDAGTFRIAVLGDSIVWGHRLTLEDSFAKQLERLLDDDEGTRVEVLNFGVSGYSTAQEVELYRVKASRFDPDLVVVGYCLNDYEDSSVEGQAFRRLYYDLFSHSYALAHLGDVLHGLSESRFGLSFHDPAKQSGLRRQFELLKEYCGEREVVVVIFPALIDFRRYLMGYQHQRVWTALQGLDCQVVDLLGAFSRFAPEALQLSPRDRTHPNALGTRLAAEATCELLVEKRLLPPELAARARQ